ECRRVLFRSVVVERDEALEELALEDGAVRWSRPREETYGWLGPEHWLGCGREHSIVRRATGERLWRRQAPRNSVYHLATLARDVVYVARWEAYGHTEMDVFGYDVTSGEPLFEARVGPISDSLRHVFLHPIPRGLLVVAGAWYESPARSLEARLTAP